ncbi:MAG: alanine--tRNA ligase [Deltaproteobacteria bacterium]|nr:alanine--tRNA ligase [Deltaproteobacteria bacterium]
MTTDDIRKAFLDFFQEQGHTIVPSSSLVPGDDPTLLFTNAGMVQFKDCFLGTDRRPYVRATTCQKCLRISGTHNDLENVGRTALHHTFFDMLGNFSFGDYFKPDAIRFGWAFLTEVLELQKERLWVTVYEEDDEAAALWAKNTDVRPDRILKMGKEDNFWAMGDTGPCGPCSEIHYFLGPDVSTQSEEDFRKNDGRYVEIWNLVFMQFNRDSAGTLTPLPKPSVDTGMGLERIALVKQNVRSNYDTDGLRALIAFTEELCGKQYDGSDYTPRDTQADPQYGFDVAFRVVADHVRAASFLIADGITPASDGRGYVLRRLIRRACRHGRVLGFDAPFLFKVAETFCINTASTYPELDQNKAKILKLIRAEEEKFLTTLGSGLSLLEQHVSNVRERGSKILSGEIAFLLHDTYGFPLDLTEDIVRGASISVDTSGFENEMEKQRERSRQARASESEQVLQRAVKAAETKFRGYEFSEYESSVLAMYTSSGEVKSARSGDDVLLVTPETPFYAESGGQLGDTGKITTNDAVLEVVDTQKAAGDTIVHICRVVEGEVSTGTRVRLAIDDIRRRKLRANHSATHLVHLALREVLGEHVKQAGSRVSEHALRFDFSHFEAPSQEQLDEIEARVNESIRANDQVITEVLPVDVAKSRGARALFGEKYGSMVRMVQIGPRSVELCGGTHVARAGDIGFFGLAAESAVASGVRRVEGQGGAGAYAEWKRRRHLLRDLSALLKSGERDLLERVSKFLDRQKVLERELERSAQSSRVASGKELGNDAKTLASGVKVVSHVVEQANPKVLREMADDLKVRLGSGCIALASVLDGKVILLTAVTDDLTKRFHAGSIVEEMTKVLGGKGGGRADMAQAGGGDPEKLSQALERFELICSEGNAA